jgi:hypothetical protein
MTNIIYRQSDHQVVILRLQSTPRTKTLPFITLLPYYYYFLSQSPQSILYLKVDLFISNISDKMVPRPDGQMTVYDGGFMDCHDDDSFEVLGCGGAATTTIRSSTLKKRKPALHHHQTAAALSIKKKRRRHGHKTAASSSRGNRRTVRFSEEQQQQQQQQQPEELRQHHHHHLNLHGYRVNDCYYEATTSRNAGGSEFFLDDDTKALLWWSHEETQERFSEGRESVMNYRLQNADHLAEYEKLFKICQEPSAIRCMVKNDAIRVSRQHLGGQGGDDQENGCLRGLEVAIFAEVFLPHRKAHVRKVLAVQQKFKETSTSLLSPADDYFIKARVIRAVSLQSSKPTRLLAKLSALSDQDGITTG